MFRKAYYKIRDYLQRKKYGISNWDISEFDSWYFTTMSKRIKRFKELNRMLPYGLDKEFYNSIKDNLDEETYNNLMNDKIDASSVGLKDECYDYMVSKWNDELDKMIFLFSEGGNLNYNCLNKEEYEYKNKCREEAMKMLAKYVNHMNW